MKKIFLLLIAVTSCIGLLTSQAFGFSFNQPVTGPVAFQFNGLSADDNVWNSNTNSLTSDPTYSDPFDNLKDGIEDVWVIGSVGSIKQGFNVVWSPTGNEDITAIIYGVEDIAYSGDGSSNYIWSAGVTDVIHVDLYLNTPADTQNISYLTSDRTGFGTYDNVTDPTQPFLSMEMVSGFFADDPNTSEINELNDATLWQDADALTGTATGDGRFWANITGGTHDYLFNQTGGAHQSLVSSAVADARGEFSFIGGVDQDYFPNSDFTNTLESASLRMEVVVPEPTTILLLGIGLLSAAGIGRKRKQS